MLPFFVSQNIQNDVSLELIIFADIVPYRFINFNWELTGSREERRSILVYDPSRSKRVKEQCI